LQSFFLFQEARETLSQAIRKAVREAYGIEPPIISLEKPPRLALGDLASTLPFDLAKTLKKPPREIAANISARLTPPNLFSDIRIEGGGYLNFSLHRGRYAAAFLRSLGAAPAPAEAAGKIIVEHTNINPNKAAHIGHLRNAVLGDTLVRCLRDGGERVEVQNYIDDTGVQVADVVVGFLDFDGVSLEKLQELPGRFSGGETVERRGKRYRCFGDLCWDLYADVGATYEQKPETKGLRAETLHALEEGQNMRSAAAAVISGAIVAEHVATMGRLDVSYDLLPRESDILQKHFWTKAFELLRERGAVLLEHDGPHAGCWVMKLSESEAFAGLDEPDKILVRSNGTVTYTGKDIAYQLWKFGRLGLDFDYRPFAPDWAAGRGGAHSVPEEIRSHTIWQTAADGSAPGAPRFGGAVRVYNVIDVRQSYLQRVVREGLVLLGYQAEAEASIHFSYEMVALTPGTVRRLSESYGDEYRLSEEDEKKPFVEMSGRRGQGVKAHDLFETLLAQASRQVAQRDPALSAAALEARARAIAVGALRYFLLKFGRNRIIAFDFDEALNFEGDTGPYLQYSAVRADNIFRKMEEKGLSSELSPDALANLEGQTWEDDLWELVLEASRISEVVERAISTLEIALVARHAFALAQAFSHFYHGHPIATEPEAPLREKRLAAAKAFREGMGRLLFLLGIPAPERM
jgi:arginyl-tRNA synthetase